jgi:hypothetical protein
LIAARIPFSKGGGDWWAQTNDLRGASKTRLDGSDAAFQKLHTRHSRAVQLLGTVWLARWLAIGGKHRE